MEHSACQERLEAYKEEHLPVVLTPRRGHGHSGRGEKHVVPDAPFRAAPGHPHRTDLADQSGVSSSISIPSTNASERLQ